MLWNTEIKNREKLKQLKPNEKTMEILPTYNPENEHLFGRHLGVEGQDNLDTTIGSTTLKDVPDKYIKAVCDAVDAAYKDLSIKAENGNPGRQEFDFQADRPVATNNVFPIENLDKNSVFMTTRDVNNENGGTKVLCAVISKEDMPKTNLAHFVMGPYGNTGNAGIYTIMWGEYSPAFPKEIDENTPPAVVERNKESTEYWYGKGDNHEGAHVILITPEALENNIKELEAKGLPTARQKMALEAFDKRGRISPIKEMYHPQQREGAKKVSLSQGKGKDNSLEL